MVPDTPIRLRIRQENGRLIIFRFGVSKIKTVTSSDSTPSTQRYCSRRPHARQCAAHITDKRLEALEDIDEFRSLYELLTQNSPGGPETTPFDVTGQCVGHRCLGTKRDGYTTLCDPRWRGTGPTSLILSEMHYQSVFRQARRFRLDVGRRSRPQTYRLPLW